MYRERNSNKRRSQQSQMKTGITPIQPAVKENLKVEDVFKSKGRVKVLKILAHQGELNISAIAQQANLNHKSTKTHLHLLVRANLVERKEFGRIRIYRFKIENPKARAIKQLFDLWDNPP